MKQFTLKALSLLGIVLCLRVAAQPTFTVTSSTGIFSSTCINPTLTLSAACNYTGSMVFYTWFGSSFPMPIYNSSVNVGPGSYTVIASFGGTSSEQYITIGADTAAPAISASPVSCLFGTVALTPTLAAGGSTTNLSFFWTIPQGAVASGISTGTLITNIPGVYQVAVTNTANGCVKNLTMTVAACVGTEEHTSSAKWIEPFPNPVKDKLFFRVETSFSQPITLKIHTVLGKLVYSDPEFDPAKELNLMEFEAGVYFITLQIADSRQTVKIIKE